MIDLVYVTYNSEKWIETCINSLIDSDFELRKINVFFVDNKSCDKTVELLERFRSLYGSLFGTFRIVINESNEGFGKGNNIGFSFGKSPYVCFFNIDTSLYKDTLSELWNIIQNSDSRVAAWELRQQPFEHPKMYNPINMETEWVSGAAFAVRREVFEQVNGFDDGIFMYCEDVDLSWRIRCLGYKLQYVAQSKINHYTYADPLQTKRAQYIYGIINNLLLRYRFGNFKDIILGHLIFARIMLARKPIRSVAFQLFKEYIRHFGKIQDQK